jgi:nickel superoxide dismutase
MKNLTNNLLTLTLTAAAAFMLLPQSAQAHCQVPCGIYDDAARVTAMLEDAATVEKAVKLIGELSGKTDAQSQNQIVRWVTNKEKHAQNIISTISDYFLTQRVKPSQEDYIVRLTGHHAVIIAAMKAKQNADAASAASLKAAIEAIAGYYPAHKH